MAVRVRVAVRVIVAVRDAVVVVLSPLFDLDVGDGLIFVTVTVREAVRDIVTVRVFVEVGMASL